MDKKEFEETARFTAPLWRLVQRNVSGIVPFNGDGSSPAFYCVHPIGGDVTSLRDLARSLGPRQRFYGMAVPKEKMNAAFAVSIKEVARHHTETLVRFQPDGALVLGGWSAGAVIALEMAQQLRARGRDVPLLIALDGAPCNTGAGISRWNPLYVWKLACNLPDWIKYNARQSHSARAFVQYIIERLVFQFRKALPAPRVTQTLDGSAVQSLLSTKGWSNGQTSFIRALYDAMLAYVPEAYTGQVLVYEARVQPLHHLLQIGAAWTKIAESVEIVVLDGNHDSILQHPVVDVLTEHLQMRMAELQQAEGASEPPGCEIS